MHRRHFLRNAATGFAAAMLAPVARIVGAADRIVVPSHLWVYAAKMPGHDTTPILDQIFADMKYAGIDGIELMHNVLRYPDSVERIGEISARNELPVIGTSYEADMWDRSAHSEILEDAEIVIEHLSALGGRTLGTSVGIAPALKTEDELDAQAELVQQLMKMADARGVVLNLHNHTYEVEDDMHDLKGTLARIPDVKLGPDLNWLIRGGVDPVWFIETYADQIVYLHLRDQHDDGRWSEALGEGTTDFTRIADALQRSGFSGDAAIELAHERDFQPTRPIRESLKQSREFVRDTMGF